MISKNYLVKIFIESIQTRKVSQVCKVCNKKKDAERYQKKKDKILTQKKRYYRRQKERQNEKGSLLEGGEK